MRSRTPILAWVVLLISMSRGAEAAVCLDSGTVGNGPHCLDVAGAMYVLIQDIVTSGSALVFAAQDVTLDLNQHTVAFGTSSEMYRYGVAIPPDYPSATTMWAESDITIRQQSHGATVRNGTILQGAGRAADCFAIAACDKVDITIQGTSITIYGDVCDS